MYGSRYIELFLKRHFLIDTGAAVSILSKQWYDKIPAPQRPALKPCPCPLKAGNDTMFNQYGCVVLRFHIQGLSLRHRFWVVDTISNGLLGQDFLEKEKAIIDNGKGRITLRDTQIRVHSSDGQPFHNRVVCQQTIHVPPGQECIVPGRVQNFRDLPSSCALMEPSGLMFMKTGLMAAKAAVNASAGSIPVRVCNLGDATDTVFKNTTVGILSEIYQVMLFNLESVQGSKTAGQEPMSAIQSIKQRL